MFEAPVAYIDPGSGSLLIQVIIASILAVPYFLRHQIGRAINAIRGRSSTRDRQGETPPPDPPDPTP